MQDFLNSILPAVPYVLTFVGGVLTHRAGLVDIALAALKPTGTASKTLTDIQAAVAEVKAIVADVQSQVSAAPPTTPVQGGNVGK